MAEISKIAIYLIMLGIAIGGTMVGILLKIMSRVEVNGARFKHPYFTWMIFFLGESFCLVLYAIEMRQLRRKYGDDPRDYPKIQEALEENLEIESSPLKFIIPALLDATRNVLFLIAIIFVPASVSNMMGALIVVVTTILVSIFLKKKFHRQHLLGICCIILGIGWVVTAVITRANGNSDDGTSTGQLIFGISMIVISVLIQGIQFIIEEKLLGNIYVSSKRLTGWEGVWGLIFFAIFLTVASFIKCTGNLCTNGQLEDTLQALEQLVNSPILFIGMLLIGFFGCLLNVLGILITKYTTSAHRATINQVKVVSIWLFFLFFNGYGTGETFLPLQLVGFIILVLGVLTFNEVLVIPCFGFNQNTKNAIYQKEYRKSMKLLWNVQDTSYERDDALAKTIRKQVEAQHGIEGVRNEKSRITVFGAGDF